MRKRIPFRLSAAILPKQRLKIFSLGRAPGTGMAVWPGRASIQYNPLACPLIPAPIVLTRQLLCACFVGFTLDLSNADTPTH